MGFPAAQHAMLCKQFGEHERARDLSPVQVDAVLANAEQLAADAGRKVGRKRRGTDGRSRMEWRIHKAAEEHGWPWVAEIIRRVSGHELQGFWQAQKKLSVEDLHNVVGAIERTEGWSHR